MSNSIKILLKFVGDVVDYLDKPSEQIDGNAIEYLVHKGKEIKESVVECYEALKDENKRLKANLDDLILHALEIENGSVDLKVSGIRAKIFFETLVQVFKQNGGKNFLCQTVECGMDNERYSITIQNMNGELTPAEKLNNYQDEARKIPDICENKACKSYIDCPAICPKFMHEYRRG